MALSALALLTTKGQTNKTTTITSASITPSANCLLVACTNRHDVEALSISTTLSNVGTWTQATVTNSGQRVSIFYANVTGSPGTGTITITGASSLAIPWRLEIAETTGHNTSAPVTQSKTGFGNSSTLTLTLDSTPAASSMVVGYVGDVSGAGVTAGTGFTEIHDSATNSGIARTQLQYDLASADTTCDWSTLNTSNNAAVAIEIAEASSGTNVTGTIATNFGALTATATGLRGVRGTIATAFGGLTATATGARTVFGAISSGFGALTATASGAVKRFGTVATDFGALTATAVGKVTRTGVVSSAFGALTATANGLRTVYGVISTAFGGLTATATQVVADTNPQTVSFYDSGHTGTYRDSGHTATQLDRGHTATTRE